MRLKAGTQGLRFAFKSILKKIIEVIKSNLLMFCAGYIHVVALLIFLTSNVLAYLFAFNYLVLSTL